jgi:ribosomal protein S18 acetylase RimI-like enzyme
MPLQTAVAAIRNRVESQWSEPDVVLAFPNENFRRPVDSKGAPQPFVMIEVRWNGGEFMSIGAPGNNLTRREGHIWAFAFVPQGSGEGLAHELAGEAASIFEGQDFAGIVCQAMSPGGPADSEDGLYYG